MKKRNSRPFATIILFRLSFVPFVLVSLTLQAQSGADKLLKKGEDLFRGGSRMLAEFNNMSKQYISLKKTLNTSSNDYNKNVTVARGNNGSSNTNPENIPEKSLNKPKIKDGAFTNLVWEPKSYFDGQLFPAAIVSMASYQGEMTPIIQSISRPIGYILYSTKSNIPLKYEIECVDKRFFDKVGGTYMYSGAGRATYLAPEIPWNFVNLTKQTTSTPVSIYFRLFDEEGNKVEKLETIQLRSINDCIFRYQDVDMKFMFSAFVQEEHPDIDNILRTALNTKMAKRWVGYQSTEKEVEEQVSAIWRVLHERGFVYSSITDNIGDGGKVLSQAVRTMDNSLKTSQANCVDGSVVFASILKKIGLSPILIIRPGHCYLAYYTDGTKTKKKFLETTWLSHTFVYSPDGKKEIEVLGSAKTNDDKNKAYLKIFADAQQQAQADFIKYSQANAVTEVDVNLYRTLIKPIPVY